MSVPQNYDERHRATRFSSAPIASFIHWSSRCAIGAERDTSNKRQPHAETSNRNYHIELDGMRGVRIDRRSEGEDAIYAREFSSRPEPTEV